MKYTARVIDRNDKPGEEWGLRIGVFRVHGSAEEQVGEYHRNYQAFFDTFCPFRSDGRDYALFSPLYHITRVMELPSCKDMGGEDPRGEGFCPTDYYVPSYIEQEYSSTTTPHPSRRRVNEPGDESLLDRTSTTTSVDPVTREAVERWDRTRPLTPRLYYPFGFVAGCVWGDDSSWKIQYLDLSEVGHGVVRRDDRFGYIELPKKMRLRDSIDMCDYHYDGEFSEIRVAVQKTFDLRTGKDHSQAV